MSEPSKSTDDLTSNSDQNHRTISLSIARYTVKEAIRNRLFYLLLIFSAIFILLGYFVGDLTITETRQFQTAIIGSLLRVVCVLLVSLFVATSMLREQSDRQLQLFMSLPIKRSSYYWGKWLGFTLLSILVATIMSLPILLFNAQISTLFWLMTFYFELMIVASISLLMLITFNQLVPSILGVLAFYTLSRSLNGFQLIAENPIRKMESHFHDLFLTVIKAINTLFPNLDQFARSDWLAYGIDDMAVIVPIAFQTLLYIGLLSAAALFDLYRKSI